MIASRGTADSTFLHPREIFRHAIRFGAVSVIVQRRSGKNRKTQSTDLDNPHIAARHGENHMIAAHLHIGADDMLDCRYMWNA